MEAVTSLYSTLDRDIEWRISEIVESGTYHPPEPVMDLSMAKERMVIAYLESEQDGLELDKLDLMLRFIDECTALMQSAAGPILPEENAANTAPEPTGGNETIENLMPPPPNQATPDLQDLLPPPNELT